MPVLLVVVVLVALGGVVALDKWGGFSILGSNPESRNTEVVNAITREQQVVLLSLGIQGIDVEKDNTDVLGFDIPGSGRTAFLQYNFDAKLGIEGEDVIIERQGDQSYLVTIPEFTFIGYDNVSFDTVVEDDGVLSSMTSDIDTAEVITQILDADAKADYVTKNVTLMRDQAQVFYEGIIRGIDPTIEVEFAFTAA